MRGVAVVSAARCAAAALSRALLYPIPDWSAPNVACTTLSTVKTGKSLSRCRLFHLAIYFSGSLLLQDRVAVHSQNVVDATDSKTFTLDGKFCARILTHLDSFVHSSNDVYLGQELLRGVLSRSDSDSKCDAPSSYRETLAMFCTSPSLHSGGPAPKSSML